MMNPNKTSDGSSVVPTPITTPTSVSLPSFPSGSTRPGSRPRIDVVLVIDLTIKSVSSGSLVDHRQAAYDEVQRSCTKTNARLTVINFQKLDFGEASVVDTFYSSDAAVVDLSIPDQQSSLLYHLAVRESFGMKNNILLLNEVSSNTDSRSEFRLPSALSSHTLLKYRVIQNTEGTKYTILTESSGGRIVSGEESVVKTPPDSKMQLYPRLRKLLQEVEVQTKAHMRDKFLTDLRSAREVYTGDELKTVLHNLRKRLDDPNVISNEVVHNMMLSFREIQDYDAMVQLIDDLESVADFNFTSFSAILNYYAFALNRRNRKGDREKALNAITSGLKKPENYVPDIVCLCGRIYKDMFTESDYTDKEALKQAIEWYRKGFEIQQSEYAGINLATLLVVSGEDFKTSKELEMIGHVLNTLIGRKGKLETLTDYWDVAIFFEISVLAERYSRAIQVNLIIFK